MSSLATVTPIRPSLAAVERQVADLDDGYTRVANELLEAVMAADLTARQLKVVLALIRKTYGFGKKFDRITNTQIAMMTGIHHTHVCKAKNEMIAMNIIVTNGLAIGINKVISEWNFEISQHSETLAKTANETLAKLANGYKPTQLNTKETITKEKKESKNTLPEQVRAEDEKSLQPTNKHQDTDEAFESIFWLAGMRKLEKKKSKSAFRTQYQEWRRANGGTPKEFASFLAGDIASRIGKQFGFDKLHPTTYLNGKRWEDEKPSADPESSGQKPSVTVSKSGYVYF